MGTRPKRAAQREPVERGAAPTICLLGPVRVSHAGVQVMLPRSRKLRALLGFLALEPGPISRSRLCDLLCDGPSDPRAELRWYLSRLRAVLELDGRPRIATPEPGLVALDVSDCGVDACAVDRVAAAGLRTATIAQLGEACDRFAGEFLDGTEVDEAGLAAWLVGRREHYRATQVALLRELATRLPPGSDEALRRLGAWAVCTPLDARAHGALIAALAAGGRVADAEAHAMRATRAFERAGLDPAPLRAALRPAGARVESGSAAVVASPSVEASRADVAPHAHAVPHAHAAPARRGSVVVLPFDAETPDACVLADGLTDDVITRLAKLRALLVIARGTAYALRGRGLDAREAGRLLDVDYVELDAREAGPLLDVDYVVSGRARRRGGRVSVLVELAATRDAGIVWADEVDGACEATVAVLDAVTEGIVAAISEQIERAECKRAVLKPPGSLDAWEAYHRGLWHMYKFRGPDNHAAERFFRDALRLDPDFARAHAGLSFTHFQNVFLGLTPARERETARALAAAARSLAADDRDPAAHWAMGRALWLAGDLASSLAELERSIELSPNFALGHYTLGFVHAQSGDPRAAIDAAEHSRRLSPFDPLQFGMLGSRALSHMRLGERDEAAAWAVRAAGRPNAHAHILAIAASSLALAGQDEQARQYVARIRSRRPGYTVTDFLRAFRLAPDAESVFRCGAERCGLV